MERDEALIVSCKVCLLSIVFDGKKRILHLKFLFTLIPWLLNSFDLSSYGWELRKRYTWKLFLMCLEKRSFGSCFARRMEDKELTWGKMCLGWAKGWRKLCKLTIKWVSSKTVSDNSTNTSCALSSGCFWDTIYWIALQKMHISEHVCKTCLKELSIKTGKPLKKYCISNISKTSTIIFLSILKTSIS